MKLTEEKSERFALRRPTLRAFGTVCRHLGLAPGDVLRDGPQVLSAVPAPIALTRASRLMLTRRSFRLFNALSPEQQLGVFPLLFGYYVAEAAVDTSKAERSIRRLRLKARLVGAFPWFYRMKHSG